MTPLRIAAAVIRRGDSILLVEQQGPDDSAPSWALPGGRVMPEEPIIAALYREVREETGLRVISAGQLAWAVEVRSHEQPDVHALVYEAEVGEGAPKPEDPDDFIISARFVDRQEAARLVEATVPWRSMSEPLLAYLRGTAGPGANWFYRTGDGGIELLELALAPGFERPTLL